MLTDEMPSSENWISEPLSIIDSLFEKNASLDSKEVSSYFLNKLSDVTQRLQIPSLNDVAAQSLVSGSLVRFRCMVQDLFDPEFFLSTCEIINADDSAVRRLCSSLYRDVINCQSHESIDFESPNNVTADRQTIYCIPVPAENKWVKAAYAEMSTFEVKSNKDLSSSRQQKRLVDDADDDMDMGCSAAETDTTGVVETAGVADTVGCDEANVEHTATKRTKTTDKTEILTSESQTSNCQLPELHFPLPDETGVPCLVKVYESLADVKLNAVIEVVGILSVDPSLAEFTQTSKPSGSEEMVGLSPDEVMEVEHLAKNPPPSLVPRIHAVWIKKLSHNNPCLPYELAVGCRAPDTSVLSDVSGLREPVLSVFEHALLGDQLAAEFLLCHLASSVYGRQNVVALGKFALNLTGVPRQQGSHFVTYLSHLLSTFVTKSHMLPLSLSEMNTRRFTPKKDYTSNRLSTGLLQLSDRTHLIVDETAMQPGQLDCNGVSNMAALSSVISWQKLDYDFEFHQQPFHTDVAVLVLSEGKSMLKCDCIVPLLLVNSSSVMDTYQGIETFLTPHLLTKIRTYIGYIQLLDYSVTDDVQKALEQDFVESRREGPDQMSVDDFHSLLTLARLLSLTFTETKLTLSTWQRAKSMECLRKQRFANIHSA